jgi:hypothetical protein
MGTRGVVGAGLSVGSGLGGTGVRGGLVLDGELAHCNDTENP